MNKLYLILFLGLILTGCADKTEYGKCIGVTEDKKPDLIYKPSVQNIVVGIILSETIIVPVVVVLDQFQCPVGRK